MFLENLIHDLTIGIMIGLPMILLIGIIFNMIRNHAMIAVTIIWSLLFSFINLSALLNSIHSSLKPYHLWFQLLVDLNLEAWTCFIYFLLIILAGIKTFTSTINQYK